jgi:hypothetical protein
MVIGLIPIVGVIYHMVSLALERDQTCGRPLTTVDRAIMSAGLLFSTLGFVDEALEGGSRLLRHLDEVEAAGVGRGLRHLDEFTAGDRALLRGDELRRALGGFDEGGALGRWQDVTAAWAEAGADLQDPIVRRLIREDKFPIKGGRGSFGDDVVRAVKWNPLGPDVDTYASLKRTKSGYVNSVTDTPGEIGLRKQLQPMTIDPRQVVPGEHTKFTAITHGPYHTWATQDTSRPVVKGPVLVFAEDRGQFYWLKEHEIQAWYGYRGVPFP